MPKKILFVSYNRRASGVIARLMKSDDVQVTSILSLKQLFQMDCADTTLIILDVSHMYGQHGIDLSTLLTKLELHRELNQQIEYIVASNRCEDHADQIRPAGFIFLDLLGYATIAIAINNALKFREARLES